MSESRSKAERFPILLALIRPCARFWLRLVHRARIEMRTVEGVEVPADGPLIVIANHVSGIDPVLVQAWLGRPIRWMMERAMMLAAAGWLWRAIRVIPVEASGTTALREAMRTLSSGGVVGIFPEGQIARPPGRVLVFRPGLAALARRTGAKVAVFVIDGIPPCGNPFVSLVRPSRARLRLVAIVEPAATAEAEEAWTESLRQSMARALDVPADTLPRE